MSNSNKIEYRHQIISIQITPSYTHLSNEILKAVADILGKNYFKNIKEIASQRNSAYLVEIKNQKLVFKIYFHGGVIRFFLPSKWFIKNRGLSEFLFYQQNLGKLTFVPQYIGAFWIKKLCFYITGTISIYLPNTNDLITVINSQQIDESSKKDILLKVGKTIRAMHDYGIFHRDLHLRNILIQFDKTNTFNTASSNDEPNVYVIDFDKAKKYKILGKFHRSLNLLRLKRNFLKNELSVQYFNYILEGYNIDTLSKIAKILTYPHLLLAKMKTYG